MTQYRFSRAIPKLLIALIFIGLMTTSAVGASLSVPGSYVEYDFGINSQELLGGYSERHAFPEPVKDGPLRLISNPASSHLYRIGVDQRGDCNHDGTVDTDDLTATVLEIWDPDNGKLDWRYTHEGAFDGSAIGCDANGLRNGPDPDNPTDSVDAADLTCTGRLISGETCESAANASSTLEPSFTTLHVADGLQVAAGQTVVAPVVLGTSSQNMATLVFTLNFDAETLNLDPTDADSDGIPDAVNLNVSAGTAKMVSIAQPGRIHVALFSTILSQPLLQNGVIASIALQAKSDVAEGTSELELAWVSLSDDQANSIPFMAGGNNVVINASRSGVRLFLPQIQSHKN